jgi:N utilization substance protein A
MDLKSFHRALQQIAEARGISPEKIIETIEAAIATAYKKDYGKKGQKIKSQFNPISGDVKFWQIKLVVDQTMLYTEEEIETLKEKKILPAEEFNKETRAGEEEQKKVVFNEEKHIMLTDAKKDYPNINTGEEIEIPLISKQDYGRIAAQTAKQVILQKIREAEKETISAEYRAKEGEIVSGIVQRVEGGVAYIDIGKTLGVLNKEEQIPGEYYKPAQRIKLYILKVEDTQKGSVVLLSRTYPKLISRLFELEVPEISAGTVVIKAIAREPGFRTKIAVTSTESGVDPIGSCVGQKGTRIMAVINEIGGEKIDVVEWKQEPEKFIANSLSPAKITAVKIESANTATAFALNDQLSLAIGKEGRNVRLAANLTGWKIDIKPAEQAPVEVLEKIEEKKPALVENIIDNNADKEKKPAKIKKEKASKTSTTKKSNKIKEKKTKK